MFGGPIVMGHGQPGGGKTPLYVNRELSWLAFNERVLMEAANPDNPAFERMKFLSIVSTNLDEFFMVRVASLRNQINMGVKGPDIAGMTPKQQLAALLPRARGQMKAQYRLLRETLAPLLAQAGLRRRSYDQLSPLQQDAADDCFMRDIYPVLTPLAVDGGRPFPLILNMSLNLGVLLADREGGAVFATLQVPVGMPRAFLLPGDGADFILMEDLIARHVGMLFRGLPVSACSPYRVTRSSDFPVDEEDGTDLVERMERAVKKRKWGEVIRLEVAHDMPEEMLSLLRSHLKAEKEEVFPLHGPLNMDFLLKQLYGLLGFEAFKYPPFTPALPLALADPEADIFKAIRQGDILLHHPYHSFAPVTHLLQTAAADPDVLAIKITLYRVSGQSPIMRALADAAQAGKQVTVMLEIKARFDEENNMRWGKRLERVGCHVIYGIKALKTHSKIALIVRREQGNIMRYVHLGTGNYNDITAGQYTDMGLLTASPAFGVDASNFFNGLTGYTKAPTYQHLVSAPQALRPSLLRHIAREADNAMKGLPAGITAQFNSLMDKGIIDALYAASQAGVPIKLLVRGICALRPGMPGVSEHIQVRSIVGRYLEHCRIFHFENGGEPALFLSSADWMTRNLDKRVELMFPILSHAIATQVQASLGLGFADTAKAWLMDSQGVYQRPEAQGEGINAQEALIERAQINQSSMKV